MLSTCHSCAAILDGLSKHIQVDRGTRVLLTSREGASLLVRAGKSTVEFYTHAGLPRPWPVIGPARTIPSSFELKDIQLISEWLHECVSNHPKCMKPNSKLPTRVIAVGSGSAQPYLYETRHEHAPYIAVSHCWGDPRHRPLTTTTATLPARMKSIPLSDLPLTFLDAVLLTRALGIAYLWIDSVCIIQDDADDWARESALMTEVYQNAVLTISADGATDSRQGLFQPVGRRAFPNAVEISSSGMANGSELYARLTDLSASEEPVHLVYLKKDNPLRDRAWTFQEWLLSSRIIHFTVGEVLWECNTLQRCECQTTQSGTSGGFEGGFSGYAHHAQRSLYVDRGETATLVNWGKVVEEFTRRGITKDTDRLPALSGLAKLTRSDATGDFVAGLWRSELPSSLLWALHGGSSRRHSRYYAPSWSWASVTGQITYVYFFTRGSYDTICELVDHSQCAATPNPFGPLRSASIKIKGPVGAFPEATTLSRSALQEEWTIYDDQKQCVGWLVVDVTDPAVELAHADEIIFLLVHQEKRDGAKRRSLGLALKPTPQDEHTFKRVGLLRLYPEVLETMKMSEQTITIV
ncbi:hypothetical protein VTK56DRAFT_4907 [Thermocarpiscus australiensis]